MNKGTRDSSDCMLSIIIPTANRSEILIKTLENIRSEIEVLGSNISVVVVDNASHPPVSKRIVDDFSVKLLRFENRGDVGDSINRAASLANSKYVWVFGDDDYICPGSLNFILYLLKKYQSDVVYLNRYIASSDMKNIQGTEHPVEVGDVVCLSGGEALVRFTHHPGFISSLIFRKSLMNGADECESRFPGYGFLAAIYMNSIKGNFLYVTKPCVIQRRSVALWKSRWPNFWLVTLPSIFEWLENEGGVKGALQSMKKEVNTISYRTILAAKANGYKSQNSFWDNASKYLNKREILYLQVVRCFLPIYIAKFIYKTAFYIKSIIVKGSV